MNILNKCEKFLVVLAAFCLFAIPSKINTYPHIPLKGLFKVLKVDDIGLGHTLLHSQWIENIYQYGPGNPPSVDTKWEPVFQKDSVANLVRTLWFRRTEDNQLLPTKFGLFKVITPEIFGKLINALYCKSGDFQEELEVWCQGYTWYVEKVQADLRLLEIEQKERIALYNRVDKLIGKTKTAKKKHETALRNKERFARQYSTLQQELARKQKALELKIDYKKKIKKLRWIIKSAEKYIGVKELDLKNQEVIEAIKNKIQGIIQLIQETMSFCETGKVYEPRTVQGILWAFFFHKIDEYISNEEKINAINDCIGCIDDELKENTDELKDFYPLEYFGIFADKVKDLNAGEQVDEVCENYDLALHYFIYITNGGRFPPVISQGDYGYEYKQGKISDYRPNCHETAMLDAISVLWYNPVKKYFDDSLFSEKVIKNGEGLKKLREALKYFYLADAKGIKADQYTYRSYWSKFTSLAKLRKLGKISQEEVNNLDISQVSVEYINRPEVKQEFFNIVSKLEGVIYCSKVAGKGECFELDSGVRNVLAIFNYFYGTKAQNLEELGGSEKGISTDSRKIRFKKQNDKNAPNKITVSVNDRKNFAYFNMKIHVNGDHTYLFVAGREKKRVEILKEGFIKSYLDKRVCNYGRSFAMLPLLDSEDLLEYKAINWNVPALHLVYYSLAMKTPEVKLALIKNILSWYDQCYHSCKPLVRNLIEALPANDQYLRCRLAKIIIESGLYEKEPFLKEFVDKKFLWDPQFKANVGGIVKLLYSAVERGYTEVSLAIVKNAAFRADFEGVSDVLMLAIEKGYIDIVVRVLENPHFNADFGDVADLLLLAVKKGHTEISAVILRRAEFNDWATVLEKILQESLENLQDIQKYRTVALEIVQHHKFKGSAFCLRDALALAFRCSEYEDIVSEILEHSKLNNLDWGEILRRTLKKGLKDLQNIQEYKTAALKIVKHPKFKGKDVFLADTLVLAFRCSEYEDIVAEFLKKTTLNERDWGHILRYTLTDGLENLQNIREYKRAALKVVRDPQFDVNNRYDSFVGATWFWILTNNEYHEVALEIISHHKFEVGTCLAQVILKSACKFVKEKPKLKQGLEKIICAIVARQHEYMSTCIAGHMQLLSNI